MLTVPRFQLALNHENPDIVIKGLEAFVERVVVEHGAGASFGYHGRNEGPVEKQIYPEHPSAVVGLLGQYLHSSPQIEELFVLWNLPGRDENKALCAVQSECIAVILHCTHQYPDLGKAIVSRMLRENAKSIHMQLISGNTSLVHSTLGLIIEMCRCSSQSAKDTFQKIMINTSSLAPLVQKGKPVNYTSPSGAKLVTDNRYLMALYLLSALRSNDPELLIEIFGSNSLFRKIAFNLTKDNLPMVQLILEGVLCVLGSTHISPKIKHVLVDLSFLKCSFQLYASEDTEIAQCAHSFLLKIVSSNILAATVSMGLASELLGHVDLRHREVQDVILRKHPQLVTKCLAAISFASLDLSRPSLSLLSSLSQCVHLIDSVDIDGNSRQEFKSVLSKGNESEMRRLAHNIVAQLIPTGLHKSAFSRLLLSNNAFVQHLSLLLCVAMYRRLVRIAGTVGRNPSKFHSILALEITSCLPDLDVFINVRSRCIKRLDEEGCNKEKQMHLHLLCLRAIRSALEITPVSLSGSNFDLVKLFDDAVVWHIDNPEPNEVSNLEIVAETLDILSLSSVSSHCRWFGTKDDASKLLVHYMVAPNWTIGIKRSSLQKLVWTALHVQLTKDNSDIKRVQIKGFKLFEQVLKNSNLFVGHGSNDTEMRLELYSLIQLWKSSVKENITHTIIIADLCIKLGFHFNAELCLFGEEGGRSPLPPRLSAITLAALHLTSINISIFESILPKPIRAQLNGPSSDVSDPSKSGAQKFLQKFEAGLVEALKCFVFGISVRILNSSWDLEHYGDRFMNLVSNIVSYSSILDSKQHKWLVSNVRSVLHPTIGGSNESLCAIANQLISNAETFSSCDIDHIPFYLYIRARCKLSLSTQTAQALMSILNDAFEKIADGDTSIEFKLVACISACKIITSCIEVAPEKQHMWSKVLCEATVLIIEVLRNTNSPSSVYEVLLKCSIGDMYCDHSRSNEDQRRCCMQILVSAAILHAKRSKNNSNKGFTSVRNLHPLWQQVVAYLEQKCELGRVGALSDDFSLGWAVQSFADVPALRRHFIERASATAGSGLLDLGILPARPHPFMSIPVDPIAHLILQSSSIESISKFFDAIYTDRKKGDESHHLNVFMGDMVLISWRQLPDDKSSANSKTISYFCDPSCLVSACIGREHVYQLMNSQDLYYAASNNQGADPENHNPLADLTLVIHGSFDASKNVELIKFANSFPITPIMESFRTVSRVNSFPEVIEAVKMVRRSRLLVEIKRNYVELIRTFLSCVVTEARDSKSVASIGLCVEMAVDYCGGAIKSSFKNAGSDEWAQNPDLDFYFSLFFAITSVTSNMNLDLTINSGKLAEHINNVIKNTLRRGIGMKSAMKFISDLVLSLNMNPHSFVAAVLKGYDASTALWNPILLLELLLAHSKFDDALALDLSTMQRSEFDSKSARANLAVLRLVLCLLNIMATNTMPSIEKNESLRLLLIALLIKLFSNYTGTMSAKDRIVFRVILLADEAIQSDGRSGHLDLPLNFGQLLQQMPKELIPGLKVGGGNSLGLRSATEYISDAVSQPKVYATLSNYPSLRPLFPPPILGLEPFVNNERANALRVCIASKDKMLLDGASYNEDDSGSQGSVENSSDNDTSCLYSQDSDDLSDATDSVYDPCFWGLVIRHYFNEGGIKYARHLSNNGVMSLAIAMLGSQCPLARCVGYSSVQCMYELCLSQTPDKDSTFRERPQILLLLEFIKNGLESGANEFSSLPGMFSLFFSRSAMHLMQSGHELYGKINKYLISRPLYDSKDVPLFDSVLASTDESILASEKLAVLRLIRDGLLTQDDHLNLCRKNAYGKLMVLFPFLCQDQRLGHAVFDLFERALSMPSAARYLVERCQLIGWIGQLLSMKLGTQSGSFATTCPAKLLTRAIGLLRKAMAALVLLRDHWSDSNDTMHFNSVQNSLRCVVNDYCGTDSKFASQLPSDYGLSIVSALWDLALASKSSIDLNWIDATLLIHLIRRLNCGEGENLDLLDAVASLAALVKNFNYGNSSTELLSILIEVLVRRININSSGGKKSSPVTFNDDCLRCLINIKTFELNTDSEENFSLSFAHSYLDCSPVADILTRQFTHSSNLWNQIRRMDVMAKFNGVAPIHIIAASVKAALRSVLSVSLSKLADSATDVLGENSIAFVKNAILPSLRVAVVTMKYIRSELSSNWIDGFRRNEVASDDVPSARDLVDLGGGIDIDSIDRMSFLSQYRLSVILAVSALMGLHFGGLRFPLALVDAACLNLLATLCKVFDITAPDDDMIGDKKHRGATIHQILERAMQSSGTCGTEWCYLDAPVKSLVALMNAIDYFARVLITCHDRTAASPSDEFDSSLTDHLSNVLPSLASRARSLKSPSPPIDDDATTDSESEESDHANEIRAQTDRSGALISKYILEQLTGVEAGSVKQKSAKAATSSAEVSDHDEPLEAEYAMADDEDLSSSSSGSGSVAEPSVVDSDENSDFSDLDIAKDGVEGAGDDEAGDYELQTQTADENQAHLAGKRKFSLETAANKRARQ